MLIDGWKPIYGGGQKHTWEICQRLVKHYHCEIDLYVRALKDENGQKFTENETHLNHRFRIYRVGPCTKFFNLFGRLAWLIWVVPFILKNHRRQKYNLIHAHAFLPAIPAKIVKSMIKRPVIYTVHGTSLNWKNTGLMTKIERWLLCGLKYDQEISVTHDFSKFKNVNKNVVCVPNGVEVAKFDRIKTEKTPYFKILYVGRFDKIKGLDYLIKGINQIVHSSDSNSKPPHRSFELHLIGDGYDEKNLKNLVSQYKLQKWIKFRGRIVGKALLQEYKSAHLFVLSSLAEGQPLTLLEAWAAKLPVLVTRVGDNEKIVRNGVNGYLIDPAQSDQLSRLILKFLSQSDLNKLGENGYHLVKKEFTWENTVAKNYQIYQKLT